MSKAHQPPTPPANRAPGSATGTRGKGQLEAEVAKENAESKTRNLEEQGRQGNINQNTHNQGYQQDR